MRRLFRFAGRSLVRLLVIVTALAVVVIPAAAFSAREVSGPWTPIDGICYRYVQRVAFDRITIDERYAIGSMHLCTEATGEGG